jgi:hypothetical protein
MIGLKNVKLLSTCETSFAERSGDNFNYVDKSDIPYDFIKQRTPYFFVRAAAFRQGASGRYPEKISWEKIWKNIQ